MGPRVPSGQTWDRARQTRQAKAAMNGLMVLAAAFANAWVAAVGFSNWSNVLPTGLHIFSMIMISIISLLLISQDKRHPSGNMAILPVVLAATAWALARMVLRGQALEEWLGNPLNNVPAETALIIFSGSTLAKWPEHWLAALCVLSYSLYPFSLDFVSSPIRDMPVTFSFVLFTCVLAKHFVYQWSQGVTARDTAS